jgi:hypothetical protein
MVGRIGGRRSAALAVWATPGAIGGRRIGAGAASVVAAPVPISWAWRAAVVVGDAVAAWSRRFWTSASALRLTSSSTFLRASS